MTTAIKQRFEPEGQNRFIRLTMDGTALYTSPPPVDGDFDPERIPLPAATVKAHAIHEGGADIFAQRFARPDGSIVVIESGHSDAQLQQARQGLKTTLVVALPIFLVIAAAGGWFLIHRTLSPNSKMIVAAVALSFNSPETRLPLDGTLEPITRLGQSLNRMLDRLANSYQHISRFSAETAHELRTPLTIARGELELVQTSADLPEHLHAALAAVLVETARLGDIVESLITLSRMDSIWGKQAHLPTDLCELAAETVEQMCLLAEDMGIALDRVVGASVTIMADRNRLKQVLVNLIDNAVKFTPPGGRIMVSVGASAGDTATIAVTDTGIGITPEHHTRIFDRFYRISTDQGAGLGLAIVKSICAAHGGTIEVRSDPGQGTCFSIVLPCGLDRQPPRPKAL
ncbi:MAG: HAMP domain-containing sensor histidine kinase [Aliidongia sp.]